MNTSHSLLQHTRVAAIAAGLLLMPGGSLLAASQLAPPVPTSQQPRLASDAEIVLAIERHLTNDPATPAHLIDVEARDGIVTLSGSVDNLLVRDRAGELAETVRGVRSVVNQLMVNPVKRPDEAIEKDAKIAIARDPATDLYQTDVRVMNGTVILTGKVESHAERELAGRVIKGVNGVKAVKNDVIIRQDQPFRLDDDSRAETAARHFGTAWRARHAELITEEAAPEFVQRIIAAEGILFSERMPRSALSGCCLCGGDINDGGLQLLCKLNEVRQTSVSGHGRR